MRSITTIRTFAAPAEAALRIADETRVDRPERNGDMAQMGAPAKAGQTKGDAGASWPPSPPTG